MSRDRAKINGSGGNEQVISNLGGPRLSESGQEVFIGQGTDVKVLNKIQKQAQVSSINRG